MKTRARQLSAVLISLAILALITVIGKGVAGLNATTMAFLYLLVVLAVSALVDFTSGLAVAVASGLLVDFYFLPPFGTFYIEAPEDWVSLVAYAATAAVIGWFAATVRQRAMEADRHQAEASRLARFTAALMAGSLTVESLVDELRRVYALDYCAIYLHDESSTTVLVSSGVRPSQSPPAADKPAPQPGTLLDVMVEDSPNVHCLPLHDQKKTSGTLVISRISLSPEATDVIAAIASLVIRECMPIRSAR